MKRHKLLERFHTLLAPRNYLEIGVDTGNSLTLSRVPSIGVDPAYSVIAPLRCDLELVRATSDDFFERPDPIRHLRSTRNPLRNARRGRPLLDHYRGGTWLDLAFIDGMHWLEFALRDFMNVERHASWATVIALDDMLPRNVDEAARERHTGDWTGDVFGLIAILERYRPDLYVLPVDTQPTGVLVVLGADPRNTVLADNYDAIVAEYVRPDPQVVPVEILERHRAVDPDVLVRSSLWTELGKRRRGSRRQGLELIERRLADIGVGHSGLLEPRPRLDAPRPAPETAAAIPGSAVQD